MIKKNKTLQYFKKHLLLVTIVFLIILGVVSLIFGTVCSINTIMGTFLISLSASLFSIIATITFVQKYLDANNEQKIINDEKDRILLFNNYIIAIYAKYKVALYEVITRKEDRKSTTFEIDKNFNFHSMCDLFNRSSLINNGMIEPVVIIFLKCEKELRESMIKMVTTIDFKHYIKIHTIANEFIMQSILYDQSYAINSDRVTTLVNGGKISDMVKEMIEDEKVDYVKEFDDKTIGSNLIVPYVILFKLIKEEIRILDKYFAEVNKLQVDKNEIV